MSIDRNYLSALFADFEREKHKDIYDLEVKNFNTWQVVKFPLYMFIIEQTKEAQQNTSIVKTNRAFYFLYRIAACLRLLFTLTRLFLKARVNKNTVLFYTSSVDKLAKDDKGFYFNFLTDSFITKKVTPAYLYIENPFQGTYKKPSYVQTDLRGDDLNNITSFNLRFYKKDRELETQSKNLFKLLQNYFIEKKTVVHFTQEIIKNILLVFFSEYKTFKTLLSICKPALIISSEQPGKGLLAAAKEKHIPSLDLQHGVIDKFHPQYAFCPLLGYIKKKMVLPTFIGVFGELHKNSIMAGNFWREEEIVVLGSSRIDMRREKYKDVVPAQKSGEKLIVIPTQWTVFNELKQLLAALLEIPDPKFKIILKIHPVEPQSNIDYFNTLEHKYSGNIQIAEKSEDIYSLIADSFLVIGFDSAVLLESVSLSKPCITITTKEMPEGIHSFYKDDRIKNAIRCVELSDKNKLKEIIDLSINKKDYYQEWISMARSEADYLYAMKYIDNCKAFIDHIFVNN